MAQPPNNPPQFPPTPRGRFLSTPENVKQHRILIENAAFRRAMEVALAEYTRVIVSIAGGNQLTDQNADFAIGACFEKISGAHEFIEIVERLAEPFRTAPAKVDKIESLEPPQ